MELFRWQRAANTFLEDCMLASPATGGSGSLRVEYLSLEIVLRSITSQVCVKFSVHKLKPSPLPRRTPHSTPTGSLWQPSFPWLSYQGCQSYFYPQPRNRSCTLAQVSRPTRTKQTTTHPCAWLSPQALVDGEKTKGDRVQLVNTFAILMTSLSPLEPPQVGGFGFWLRTSKMWINDKFQ